MRVYLEIQCCLLKSSYNFIRAACHLIFVHDSLTHLFWEFCAAPDSAAFSDSYFGNPTRTFWRRRRGCEVCSSSEKYNFIVELRRLLQIELLPFEKLRVELRNHKLSFFCCSLLQVSGSPTSDKWCEIRLLFKWKNVISELLGINIYRNFWERISFCGSGDGRNQRLSSILRRIIIIIIYNKFLSGCFLRLRYSERKVFKSFNS